MLEVWKILRGLSKAIDMFERAEGVTKGLFWWYAETDRFSIIKALSECGKGGPEEEMKGGWNGALGNPSSKGWGRDGQK